MRCSKDTLKFPVRRHKGTRGDMANDGLSTSGKGLAFSASPETEAASGCCFRAKDSEACGSSASKTRSTRPAPMGGAMFTIIAAMAEPESSPPGGRVTAGMSRHSRTSWADRQEGRLQPGRRNHDGGPIRCQTTGPRIITASSFGPPLASHPRSETQKPMSPHVPLCR